MMFYIISIIIAVANLVLGILVYRKNRKFINRLFFILTVLIFLWILSNGLADFVKNEIGALFWTRMTYLSSTFILYSLLLFSRSFNEKVLKRGKLDFLLLTICFFVALISLTGLVVKGVTIESWGSNPIISNFVYIVDAYYIIYLVFALYTLIKKRHKASGILRLQLTYILLGFGLSAIITLFISLIIPQITDSAQYAKLAPLSLVLLIGFISYSIVKHRLLDIGFAISRSVIYGLLLAVVSLSFTFITFLSGFAFGNSVVGKGFISFLVAGLIVFGLDPLKHGLSRITDKVFFQAKIDYANLLQRLSNIASLEIDIQRLTDDLERGMIQGLKVKNAMILLRDQKKGITHRFRATLENDPKQSEVNVDNDSPLIQFLREHRHLSLYESLERKIEDTPVGAERTKQEASKAEFEKISAALIAPIFSQDHLVAILTLGPKLSGDSFSNDDIHLIEVLTPQIGSAIQKANLYDEVRQFSEGLKVRVDEATHELRDRNVSLQTLQNITKEITRTLDFNKVVQNIANAVATELGFLGAILIMLDDDGKTLRARAVTETPLTAKAMKLLPKPVTSYTTELTNPSQHTLAYDVINSGEIRFSTNMAEVLTPPIPKLIANAMQKVIGIHTMILVPIVSEQKVIGVIEVGAKRSREAITQGEIETLQSMADELGVVARNISLFDRIRTTNDQLEVANKHLQELDRAKSEFVSIASHQLRTPMTGIMGYLSMMTQGDFGKLQPEHQKILVDLLSESQRMIRLINQFLNVSKIEAGKFTYTYKPTQLEEVVEHVVKEIEKPAADKGLQLTMKMPKSKLPIFQADTDKLEDVILNLLDNAIKYTAKGTIVASLEKEGDVVHFRVKDSGIGIKPQDASELFNKFVRGSGIAQIHPDGSGLGLFIAKSIIDAHGGRIWAESEGEGKGSTFQFTIPIKSPKNTDISPDNAAAIVSSTQQV